MLVHEKAGIYQIMQGIFYTFIFVTLCRTQGFNSFVIPLISEFSGHDFLFGACIDIPILALNSIHGPFSTTILMLGAYATQIFESKITQLVFNDCTE